VEIKDSGERRTFPSGAVRDINSDDKGRCDLLPLDVVAEIMNDKILNYIHSFQEDGDYKHLLTALSLFCDERYGDWYTFFLEEAKHYSEGAKKYSEDNWKRGINLKSYIDSSARHYLKWRRGDDDEPHDRAFGWNLLSACWTCMNKPELNDFRKEE
jgi:hypothetical protein